FNENKELDKDTFVHRYCHLTLEELFNKTDFALGERRVYKFKGKKDLRRKQLQMKARFSVKLSEFMKGSLDLIIN
ncbi:9691_t:CDS:2, partial [Funneliformis mosseae]